MCTTPRLFCYEQDSPEKDLPRADLSAQFAHTHRQKSARQAKSENAKIKIPKGPPSREKGLYIYTQVSAAFIIISETLLKVISLQVNIFLAS